MIIPEIQIDESQYNRVIALLGFKGTKTVIRRALNKVGTSARQEISVGIRKDLPMKAGDLKRDSLTLEKANNENLIVKIKISGKRISLKRFSARQTKTGVSYSVQKGKRSKLKSAFIAQSLGSHVYKRKSADRIPLIKLFGPSVPHVFENLQQFAENVYDKALSEKLTREIDVQLNLELEKRG